MNIIFLDIDGVLNNMLDSEHHKLLRDCPVHFYSERCVKHLNKLIEKTNSKVVVSSTWRLGKTEDELQDMLNEMGVICTVVGRTDSLGNDCFRGNEILKWIKDNEAITGQSYFDFRSYVILDDDTDMLLWQKDNFVVTDPEIGLTERGVYKAIAILKNSPCEDTGQEFQP